MNNTAENVAQKDGKSEQNYQLDSAGQGPRRLERTKKDRVDGRTETKKRRMGLVVIAGSTKTKLLTDAVKSRTPPITATRYRQSSASF